MCINLAKMDRRCSARLGGILPDNCLLLFAGRGLGCTATQNLHVASLPLLNTNPKNKHTYAPTEPNDIHKRDKRTEHPIITVGTCQHTPDDP